MDILTFVTIVFAAALILVEVNDSAGSDLTTRPISHYFGTATSVVQDAAFILLALTLFWHSWILGVTWLAMSFVVIGVGLLLAMSTDTWPKMFFGIDRQLHYTGAALCFIGGLSMMLAFGTYVYAMAYVLGALLLVAIDREHTAVQEKVGVLMLVVWLFGYSLVLF